MTNLSRAFKNLRKLGYEVRRNYKCCSSCAGAALANEIEVRLDGGADREAIKGVVFYHSQDASSLRAEGQCHLSFGSVHTAKYGDVGLATDAVGRAVVKALRECGVEVEWNGKATSRILFKAS